MSRSTKRWRVSLSVLTLVLGGLLASSPSLAATLDFVPASGAWVNPANWNNGAVPYGSAPLATDRPRVAGKAITIVAGDVAVGNSFEFMSGTGSLTMTGGTLTLGSADIGGGFSFLMRGTATFDMQGGTFSVAGSSAIGLLTGTANFQISDGSATFGGAFNVGRSDIGVLTVSGGQMTVNNNLNVISVGASGAAAGTVNLNGGILAVNRVAEGTVSSNVGTFNFNGGTLKALIDTTTFMTGLDRANVRDGGAVIDTDGRTVTVGQALEHSNIGGDAVIDGGLTKTGAGTLVLTGSNTYTGVTTISGGTLQVGSAGGAGTLGTGEVINDAALAFNRTGSLTVGNAISGTGSLTQSGTGTIILSGDNTYIGGTTISGGTLQVGAGGTSGVLGAGNVVNNAALAFNRSDSFTVSNAISGTGSLTQSGTGTIILGGDNSYGGLTTVSTGTLAVAHNNALGSAAGGTTVANGATLALQDGVTVTGETLTIAGSGVGNNGALRNLSGDNVWTALVQTASGVTSRINSDGGSLTLQGGVQSLGGNSLFLGGAGQGEISGTVSNLYQLVKDGSGGWILSGDNTYTTATTVNAGVLNIRHANALGTTGSGTTVSNGAALEIQGGISVAEGLTLNGTGIGETGALRGVGGDNTWTGQIALATAPSIGVEPGGSLTVTGKVTGSGGLTKVGGGTLVLTSGSNDYSGGTTISGGTLQIGAGGTGGALGGGGVTNNASLVFDRSNQYTIANTISGTGSVTMAGTGQPILNNSASTYSGGTILSAGEVILQASSAGPAGAPTSGPVGIGTLTFDGGTMRSTTGAAHSLGNQIVLAADTTFGTLGSEKSLTFTGPATLTGDRVLTVNLGSTVSSSSLIFSGAIGDEDNGYSLTKAGTGRMVLSGNNTYSGGTTISGGTLQIGAGADSGSLGTGNVVNNASLVVNRTGSLTIADDISGSGSLTKEGGGTLILSGGNSYGGITTVNAGVLRIQNPAALGTTGVGTVVNDNARLELAGGINVSGEPLTITGQGGNSTGALNSFSGDNTWDGPITLGNNNTRIGAVAGAILRVPGVIGGANPLTVRTADPSGKVYLSGVNTYTGQTNIVVGSLLLDGGDDRLPVTSHLNLGNTSNISASVFDLNGWNQQVAGVSSTTGTTGTAMSLTVTNSSATQATLTLASGSNHSYRGLISGDLSLVKNGAGTQTLSGNNTYTGDTTVLGGTLALSGAYSNNIASSPRIELAAAGVLDVAGLNNGELVLTSGQTLAGTGTVVGGLVVDGAVAPGHSPGILNVQDVAFANASTLQIELNGPAVGSEYDRLASSGAVGLGEGWATLDLLLGFDPSYGQTFTIVTAAEGVSGWFAGLEDGTIFRADYQGRDYSFGIQYLDNEVVLQAVPEPLTGLLLLGGLPVLAGRLRRRWRE